MSDMIVAAHRGYSAVYPENTMTAFAQAMQLRVDMLEFDLRATSDGEIVVIHDASVQRTTNGSGMVSEMTLAQLQALDAGSWKNGLPEHIPTLHELMTLVAPTQLLFNVEFKEPDTEVVDRSLDILGHYGVMQRCVFTSFHAAVVHYVAGKGWKCQGFPGDMMHGFVDGPQGTYACMYAMGIPMKRVTPEFCAQVATMGIQPWPYCPDDRESARWAAQSGGVAVTCNDPVPALALFRQMQIHV